MRQAQDLVWNTITESGKRRFDYTGFKNSLGDSGDDRTAEYILFQIIVGLAEELSSEEFLSKIRGDLSLFGYSLSDDELDRLLSDKNEILKTEIRAAQKALSEFAAGTNADKVLDMVRQLLL